MRHSWVLLEYGADIDSQGAGSGKTAFHQAARAGKRDAMRLLLTRQVNTEIPDSEGRLARDEEGYVDLNALEGGSQGSAVVLMPHTVSSKLSPS